MYGLLRSMSKRSTLSVDKQTTSAVRPCPTNLGLGSDWQLSVLKHRKIRLRKYTGSNFSLVDLHCILSAV